MNKDIVGLTDVTATSMFAGNTTGGTICVEPTGTSIPLPNNQNLDGFTANGANTVFTVPDTGRYGLTYSVALSAAILVSTRVLVNGVSLPAAEISPSLANNTFTLSIMASLNAGDTLELQLVGSHSTVTLQSGAGASLYLIRLS